MLEEQVCSCGRLGVPNQGPCSVPTACGPLYPVSLPGAGTVPGGVWGKEQGEDKRGVPST